MPNMIKKSVTVSNTDSITIMGVAHAFEHHCAFLISNIFQKTYYVKEAKTTYYIPPSSPVVTEAPKVKKSISQSIFPQNEIESATDTLIIKELPRKTNAKPLVIKELPKVKWHFCSKIVSLKSLNSMDFSINSKFYY